MANRTTKPAATKPRRGELPAEFQARKLRARLELLGLRQAEKAMKAALANYGAADRGRRNRDWRPSSGSADLMIIPETPTLNARARQAVRDSWIGASMIRAAKRNVAGVGIDVVPTAKDAKGRLLADLNRRIRSDFWRWASDKRFSDLERRQNFWQKQRLAVAERYTVGQHFIVWSYKSPLGADGKIDLRQPVGLRLQSFEPEQLDQTIQSWTDPATSIRREVRGGVEIDTETNATVAYHFYTKNPADYLTRTQLYSRRVEAAQVFHYFDQERVLQTQGVTQLAPVLQEIRDFNRFKEATLWRAIMEACIGVIVKKNDTTSAGYSPMRVNPAPGDTGQTSSGMNTIDFVPGMSPHLAPGEEIEPFTPSSPGNQYDPFTTITLRGIGAGAGMSYDQISRHSDANYSAARQNMLEDWREWEIEQDNLASDVILPVYTLFVSLSILEGRFDAEAEFDADDYMSDPNRYTDATCIAPARPWIDPEKEANGYKTLIDYRIITREEIMAGRGKRFVEQIHKIGEERDEAKTEGVTFPEDVVAQSSLMEAKSKVIMAEAAVQKADNVAPADAPNADPGQPPPTKPSKLRSLAQADAPNYRESPLPEITCATCRFFVRGRGATSCTAYDFAADPAFTCDAFESRPVTEIPDGRASVEAPPIPDGQVSIDDAANGGFTPDGRLAANEAVNYSYSSTQIDLPEPLRSDVLAVSAKLIPNDLLAGDGREIDPHCTVLYGLKAPAPNGVKAIAANVLPFNVTLGEVTHFEQAEYDVVVVAVVGTDLVRLHNLLSALPHKPGYAEYKPHVTLAYVAKGHGGRWDGDHSLSGRSVRVNRITFSASDGRQYFVDLTGSPSA